MVMSVEGERNGGSLSSISEAEQLLTPQQNQALGLLVRGIGICDVAEKVGVHRTTVFRWLKGDAGFRAAYNTWLAEQRESCRAALMQCAQRAVQRISTSVDINSDLAMRLVKALGLLPSVERLYTEPAQVQQVIDLEAMEEKASLEQRWAEQLEGDRPDLRAHLAAMADALAAAATPQGEVEEISAEEAKRRATMLHRKEMDRVATTIG